MQTGYIILISIELLVILLVFIIRVINKKHEDKTVEKILNFFKTKTKDKETEKKFKECLEIIKQNNKGGN